MKTIELSFKNFKMTDDEFYHFCLGNPDLKFERNKQGQILIMPNTGGNTGRINSKINLRLGIWNEKYQLGEVFDSSTAFQLPSSAVRSPDASWVSKARWGKLHEKEQKQFPPLCPDFVIELKSESDTFKELNKKILEEWMENGCQLAWLIDTKEQKAYIYRPNQVMEIVDSFEQNLNGESILPEFELVLKDLI